MDRAATPGFGAQLRSWRQRRGLSQLSLALAAEVSARHLSWLEADKSQPSRAMVLRLAERLEVPLRERNGLLMAAGFAPMYGERGLDDPALAPARNALQRLLDAHEPWPALAVDRHWNLVAHNRMIPLLLQQVRSPALLQPPCNVLRVSLHPEGLATMVENLGGWREHVLARLQRQISATGDARLLALHEELRALPGPEPDGEPFDPVAQSLVLRSPLGRLAFITTLTVFGAPHDVLLSELAIETLLPADAETAERLRQVHAARPQA
ncbi:MAG: helix-turn-helix transcriptional regulator [Rubrivivax sp.]